MQQTRDFLQRKIQNRQFALDHAPQMEKKKEKAVRLLDKQMLTQRINGIKSCLDEARQLQNIDGNEVLTSRHRILGKPIVFMKRVIRKLLKVCLGWYLFPIYAQQSSFNHHMIRIAEQELQCLESLRDACANDERRLLEGQDAWMRQKAQLDDMQDAWTQHAEQIAKVQDAWTHHKAWMTELQEALQSSRAKIGDLQTACERQDAQWAELMNLPTNDDDFYHDFEERFRGSFELIRDRESVYVPLIQQHLPDWSKARFVDIGSGRGEWLDILREHGAVDYVGVDLNETQNRLTRQRGHQAMQQDCIAYLKELPEGCVDLISGFQIIEHLPMATIMTLLKESHRVLKKGGMILFETNNPCNLMVGADTFYLDPSHRRPLDPRLMEFLAEYCGFKQVQAINNNSHPYSEPIADAQNEPMNRQALERLNSLSWTVFGPQDYALFGVKE